MTQERKAFEVDCKWGNHRILMTPIPEGKWSPRNLDGTPHNCRDQKNMAKQKPSQPGQIAFLSDSMTEAVRKIAREEARKEIAQWYNGMNTE